MSHTDKDAPAWVRAMHHPSAEAHHAWRCREGEFVLCHPNFPAHLIHECDLDRPGGTCRWWVDDRDRAYYDRPDGPEIHLRWFGPERAHVRTTLLAALRDYNTHGETDLEPDNRRTRGGTWAGGWWD